MQDRNAGNWQNHEITYYYLIFKAKSGFYASCACKAVYSLIPLIFSFKAAIYSQFSRVIINAGLGSPEVEKSGFEAKGTVSHGVFGLLDLLPKCYI